MKPDQIITAMNRVEAVAQNTSQKDEQIKRLTAELREYIAAEEVLVAAGLVSKQKIEQAHDLVRKLS